MDGRKNSTDSWLQQIKSYTAGFQGRVEFGVEAVKAFLFTLTSDERWGVMVAFEEQEPEMFGELIAKAPDWVQWME